MGVTSNAHGILTRQRTNVGHLTQMDTTIVSTVDYGYNQPGDRALNYISFLCIEVIIIFVEILAK